MFITVTCPKCGRSIKAKKKFVLSTGGVPCLRCKVRIAVSKEQVAASSEPVPAESAAPAAEREPVAVLPAPDETPAPELVAEPAPMPEPPPSLPPEPISIPLAVADREEDEESTAVTPVMAEDASDFVSATQEIPSNGIPGPQIAFTCPHCQNAYPIRKSLAGKKIRCKGCSRIVKVAADSPVIPGTDPEAPPPPIPDDDIPVIYSPAEAPPAPAPNTPPIGQTDAPETSTDAQPGVKKNTSQLRSALSGAEDRASTAEEMIQQLIRDKASSELAAARKIRELDGQIRDLSARLKAREEDETRHAGGMMKRAEVESLIHSLCEALDANLQQEIEAHKRLIEDLKKQIAQALHQP